MKNRGKIKLFGLSFYVGDVLYLYTKIGENNAWQTLDKQNLFYGFREAKEQFAIQDRIDIIEHHFKFNWILTQHGNG